MKVLVSLLVFLFGFNLIQAQCGSVIDCNPNTGIYSNDSAADIAYDNMGSAFHTTYIKEPSGGWKVWGEYAANDGISNVLSPVEFDAAHYPALTGTIYKMAVGSNYGLVVQLIVLTSDGLFVLGTEGTVLSADLTTSTIFQKITVNGKADGLPAAVAPADVKMLFATNNMLMITTCNGTVYVLSTDINARGDGGIGNELQWSRVMQNATTPLSNVIVSRGTARVGFALKSDGTLWTWGEKTNLGNGTASIDRPYATQMYLPDGLSGIKMIQCTSDINSFFDPLNVVSYYILGTNKKVYSMGTNNKGQLGDRTSLNRLAWVNAKNPDNSIITDAAWISSNEHDGNLSSLAVLKTNGVIYTCGNNSYYMVGRTNPGTGLDGDINYLDLPTGISATDFITFAEAGGHTCALVKRCTAKYGYVGHRVRGSIGDGSDVNETIPSYDFTSPPAIAVCGAQYTQPTIVTSNNSICYNQTAVFTINGVVGDVITYNINSGTPQTITLTSASQQVVVANATVNQTINLTQVSNATVACTYDLTVSATVSITPQTPVFNQISSICEGQQLNPLPTTSTNGVQGVWSPALNNLQTTTYTFTPSNTCSDTTLMTITVIPKITPTFTQIAPICEGDALSNLPLTSNNGYSGSWSPAINNMHTTTYTFTPTPISGVCLGAATMTIVVNLKTVPTFTQVPPICVGSTLADLPLISNNSIQGTWTPALNNLQTTTYTFTPTPITGLCADLAHMTIVVNQKVIPTFPAFPTLCYGDNLFNLPLVSNNGFSGTWSPPLNTTAATSYTFTPNSNQCALTAVAQVPVYADFDFNYEIVCSENSIVVEATSTENLEYTWQIDNAIVFTGATFNLSDYIQTTPIIEVFPILITISAVKDNCSKIKNITVTGSPCEIPNVITPNNDTLNDSFDLTGYDVAKLIIYNRWGRKVYEKANYLNEWHGQNNHGNDLPDGTYFYIVDTTSGESKTGWVYVVNR